jgi:hypothetical protein
VSCRRERLQAGWEGPLGSVKVVRAGLAMVRSEGGDCRREGTGDLDPSWGWGLWLRWWGSDLTVADAHESVALPSD